MTGHWLWAVDTTGRERQIGSVAVAGQTYFALAVTSTITGIVDVWSQGATLVGAAVTVGLTEVALAAANTARRAITIFNNASAAVLYVGPTGVTTASGMRISPQSSGTFSSAAGAAWFGISDTAGTNVRVLEERT